MEKMEKHRNVLNDTQQELSRIRQENRELNYQKNGNRLAAKKISKNRNF